MAIELTDRECDDLIQYWLLSQQRLNDALATTYPDDRRANTQLIREALTAIGHLSPLIEEIVRLRGCS